MPPENVRKEIIRNGTVVIIDGKPVRGERQADQTWILRYVNPFTRETITRSYADEAACQTAMGQLETDYLSARNTRQTAEEAFNATWG